MTDERPRRRPRSKLAHLAPRVALSCAVLLGGLAVAELWARHNLYDDWYVRSSSPDLRFELKSAEQRSRFDDGGRIARQRTEGVVRIVVLGDSVAWGSHLSPHDTIPRRLEQALRTDPLRPGEDYEVLNAAVPGYDIHQALATYRERVLPYDPDIVLYLFAVNDFVVSDFLEAGDRILMVLPSSEREAIGEPGRLVSRAVTASALAAWAYTAYLGLVYDDPRADLIRVDYEWGGRSLAEMASLARDEGDRFVTFLLGPFGVTLPSDAECAERGLAVDLCWMTLALVHARQHCRQQQLECVDINDLLRVQKDRDFRITPGDTMHPDPAGAALWAEAIADHLRSNPGR